jgi:GT2 family glycosyltransferase
MNICILTVDYGKPQLTAELFQSLVEQQPHGATLEVFVLENSGLPSTNDYAFLSEGRTHQLTGKVAFRSNLGYFGTASDFLATLNPTDYDWIIVCNNDLRFDHQFVAALERNRFEMKSRFLVCPSVIERDRDVNPLSRARYPAAKIRFWDFYYRHRLFALAYEGLRLPVSRLKVAMRTVLRDESGTKGEIFLGYGAIYLLNPRFIELMNRLPAETFLYQEEAVICAHARRLGQSPYFLPELKVFHESHATLRLIAFDRDYAMRRDAWWATRCYLVE